MSISFTLEAIERTSPEPPTSTSVTVTSPAATSFATRVTTEMGLASAPEKKKASASPAPSVASSTQRPTRMFCLRASSSASSGKDGHQQRLAVLVAGGAAGGELRAEVERAAAGRGHLVTPRLQVAPHLRLAVGLQHEEALVSFFLHRLGRHREQPHPLHAGRAHPGEHRVELLGGGEPVAHQPHGGRGVGGGEQADAAGLLLQPFFCLLVEAAGKVKRGEDGHGQAGQHHCDGGLLSERELPPHRGARLRGPQLLKSTRRFCV